MRQPVKMKLFFGLFILSRNAYLFYQFVSFAVLGFIWFANNFVFGLNSKIGSEVHRDMPWVHPTINWLIYVGVIGELLEMVYLLPKYHRGEKEMKKQRGDELENLEH